MRRKWCYFRVYRTPYTQDDGVVERWLCVNLDRALAMCHSVGLKEESIKLLWAEACSTANLCMNIFCNTGKTKYPYQLFYSKLSKLHKDLVQVARIGYVTKREKTSGKLSEKTTKMICVGFAQNYPTDTYRMYNSSTKRISISRDIKWEDWVPTNTKELTMYDFVDKSPGVEENDDLVDLPDIEQGEPLPVLE